MPVEERIGGAMLLRQPDPPLLLGSCSCLLSGSDQGWTVGSFYRNESSFRVVLGDRQIVFQMSFDVALSLAGILTVTSLQGLPPEFETSIGDGVECKLNTAERDRPVCLLIPVSPERAKFRELDDQVEVRLRSLVARVSADSIFDLAARTFR